jgi:hypothetical protein
MTDPISDMLTRIRNAHQALLTNIELPGIDQGDGCLALHGDQADRTAGLRQLATDSGEVGRGGEAPFSVCFHDIIPSFLGQKGQFTDRSG